jgi:thiamine biosynthesis lipoprotein
MNTYMLSFRAMGCAITIQLQTREDGMEIMAQIPQYVEDIEAQLSRFRPQSDLMRLNGQAGQWVAVSDLLFEIIAIAKHTARLTNGHYNPLVLPAMIANGYDRSFDQLVPQPLLSAPKIADWREIMLRDSSHEVRLPAGSALDLGGIAKGWMATRIADQLMPHGACLVNFGGDMVARGASDWDIAIHDPHTNRLFTTLALTNTSIVTSGIDYRHWQSATGDNLHHIINPRTGKPAITDVISATVIHPNACHAEAYAKAVIIMGARAGLLWLASQWDAHGIVICADGSILGTPKFSSLRQYKEAKS